MKNLHVNKTLQKLYVENNKNLRIIKGKFTELTDINMSRTLVGKLPHGKKYSRIDIFILFLN